MDGGHAVENVRTDFVFYPQAEAKWLFIPCERWLSGYNLQEKCVNVTMVPEPLPTALESLRKKLNRVVGELQGLNSRRAKAIIKHLNIQGRILLRQGSTSANDNLPSRTPHLNPDEGLGMLAPAFVCFITSPLVTVTSGMQRIAYHITSTVVMVNHARWAVMLFRLVPKPPAHPENAEMCSLTGPQRRCSMMFTWIMAQNPKSVRPGSLCVRIFWSKRELFDSLFTDLRIKSFAQAFRIGYVLLVQRLLFI
ncbi:hypothetical protein CSKR_103014 [Clonorchis sinensis]|uniref:Uncharacterized protein n=2 Tax=Clonorchis sinensis TaxID=79923 RepID=A0A8T1M669_CLOSI|nr:hypothetical protein CSKR_103014 [Clonorchis sinensis]GAA48906.1 hypothetical protein CLF_102198 [Clonorchis sinensis]